jgi:7-cyano-7-deazaguanine synthase
MAKVVVIYSGGMDSYTVLHTALAAGHEVFALSFNYGQRHVRELACAATVCRDLEISHKIIDITAMNELMAGSSLTDNSIDVAKGHYAEESMKSTVVPNRNMILLSLAIGYAVSIDATAVYYGAHAGDHAIYPDCRPEFVEQMNAVSLIANYQPIPIVAPFLQHNKADILAAGLALGLDYTDTWTCYVGAELACGECGACVERLEAFAANKRTDPICYATD